MSRAVSPRELPCVPESATGWRRTARRGSMFHLHKLGHPVCGAKLYLGRSNSEALGLLAEAQYWGLCPRCVRRSEV